MNKDKCFLCGGSGTQSRFGKTIICLCQRVKLKKQENKIKRNNMNKEKYTIGDDIKELNIKVSEILEPMNMKLEVHSINGKPIKREDYRDLLKYILKGVAYSEVLNMMYGN